MSKFRSEIRNSLSGLAVLLVLFLFLQGCRQSGGGKRTTVNFCTEGGIVQIEQYTKIIADFNKKHPEIKIYPIYVQRDYYSKLLTMFASGTQPDLFWMGQGFADFAQRGCLMELDKEVDPELVKKIVAWAPEILDLYKHKGKLMGIPVGINVAILYYNATLFDQAGLKYPDENWNTEDFLAAAKALTKDLNGDGRVEQFGAIVGDIRMLYNSFGGSVLSRDGTRSELAAPGSIAALAFTTELVTKHKVSPKPVGGDREGFAGQDEPFLTGRIAMVSGTDINMEHLRKSIRNFTWDIAPIPCNGKKRYWASSSGFCISAGTKVKKEALVFLEYLASDPVAQKLLAREAIPISKDIAREVVSETKVPKHAAYLLDVIKYATPPKRIPGITEIESIVRKWEERVRIGIMTPADAYKEAAKEINVILDKNKAK